MAFFKDRKKTVEKRRPVSEKPVSGGVSAALQNPKILEVNLIKDEAQVSFDWAKNLMMLGLVLVVGALLVGEVYYTLDNWEENETALLVDIQKETDRLNAEIAKLRNESADSLSYQERAMVFSEILDNHVYWSKLLGWVEKNTLNSVSYAEFSGDLSGSYVLKATAATYSDISWQANVFLNSPEVKEVSIRQANSFAKELQPEGGAEADPEAEPVIEEKVKFDIAIDLKPEIFKK